MSKKQKPAGISWGEASDVLKAKVKFVLQQTQNNRYSVSRIYAAHNGVFQLQEVPQTCSTCLTTRAGNLRRWWGANAPSEQPADDTEQVLTTGEAHTAPEATTYESVLAKYRIVFDPNSEIDTLGAFISAGASTADEGLNQGITPNELELLAQRHRELTGISDGKALETLINDKFTELGLTPDSTKEELLEACKLLAEGEDINTESEQAYYVAQIEILERQLAEGGTEPTARTIDMGEGVLGMVFTPSAEDVTKGTIANADGSKVKAGTYTAADGTVIAVAVGGKATIK